MVWKDMDYKNIVYLVAISRYWNNPLQLLSGVQIVFYYNHIRIPTDIIIILSLYEITWLISLIKKI